MAKGSNQKLKISYLTRIMLEKTDDEHGLTVPQIIEELAKYDVDAERKSIYSDFEDMIRSVEYPEVNNIFDNIEYDESLEKSI